MKWFILKLLLNVVLIPTFILITMKLTAPSAVTSNFLEGAPRFYVLGISNGNMKMLTLKEATEKGGDYEFHLGQDSIELNVGDIHRINVVENNENEQVIEFNYQNTYSSTSIYKVSNNKITPLKYKINHHIGQGLSLLVALVLALVVSGVTVSYLKRRSAESNPI